jgi:diguanylate cyclase (GGDEF)-like protein
MSTPSNTPLPSSADAVPATVWDHSTLRLSKGDATLLQALGGDSGQRCACLIVYSGTDVGRRIALDRERTVLGRMPDCEAPIDSPGISRRHAELLAGPDVVLLCDLGSANGTHVNGLRLDAPTPLRDGDLVRLGEVTLKFYDRLSLDAVLHDRIYRMATVDVGTEVYTRRYVLEVLEREVQRARRGGPPLSLVALDLDHFKAVNDRWGHNAGDLVLRQTAAIVQAAARGSDTVGRLGGEEFVVLMPDTDLASAAEAAERMRRSLAIRVITIDTPEVGPPVLHRQTASVGVARFSAGMRSVRDLLGAADAMVYEAKREGRNRVCFKPPG